MLLPKLLWRLAPLTAGMASIATLAAAQQYPNTITTAVPLLTLSPDARSAALGQAGVALAPDANAAYYNAGKLSFVPADYSFSPSYTPWRRGGGLASFAGYARLSQRSVLAASVQYDNVGSIFGSNTVSSEYAVSTSYGYQLNEHLGVGATVRYIQANLSSMSEPSRSAATDLGVYYTKNLNVGASEYNLGLGASLVNVGSKMTYTSSGQTDFLPTTLKIGAALTHVLATYSTLTFVADANKLLVPTPYYRNGLPINYPAVVATNQARAHQTVVKAMLSSFSDAPGGFREEVREIMLSTGLEYAYNNRLFARAGYYYESPRKGDRQYVSVGLGIHYHALGLDGAYILPNNRENPLAQTLRLSLHVTLQKRAPSPDQSS